MALQLIRMERTPFRRMGREGFSRAGALACARAPGMPRQLEGGFMRLRISPLAVWLASMAAVVLAVSPTAASDPIALAVKGRANATPAIAADGPFVIIAWG